MAKKKRRQETAEEFMARLERDPEYQARTREREAKQAAREAELTRDEASLVEELQQAGVEVVENSLPWARYEGPPRSVWDLVNTKSRYPDAISVLIRHLQIEHDPRIKEGIVRALGVPEAQGLAFGPLVDEFCRIDDPDSSYKWTVGMVIPLVTTAEDVPSVLELIADERHGHGRAELPLAILWLPMNEAEVLLEPMLDDPELKENATAALKRIRRRRGRSS